MRDFLAEFHSHYGVVVEPFKWLEVGDPDQLIHAAGELAPDDEGRVPGCYIHPAAVESQKITRCILGPGVALNSSVEDHDAFWFLEDGNQVRRPLGSC